MVCQKEIGAHTFEILVHSVHFFSFSEFSNSMDCWARANEFASPLITSECCEEGQLRLEKGLTHHDTRYWKLPFICIFVLYDEIGTVLARIVQALTIHASGINFAPIFGGCAILIIIFGLFIPHLV